MNASPHPVRMNPSTRCNRVAENVAPRHIEKAQRWRTACGPRSLLVSQDAMEMRNMLCGSKSTSEMHADYLREWLQDYCCSSQEVQRHDNRLCSSQDESSTRATITVQAGRFLRSTYYFFIMAFALREAMEKRRSCHHMHYVSALSLSV